MSDHDKYRTGDLIRAMFSMTDTPEEYEHLYTMSATFKSGVDVFVGSLVPIFLRGLSHEAINQDNRRDEMVRETMSRAPQVRLDVTGVDGESLKRAFGLEED